jgi:translation elongation factor EF-Tu-like GTPase
MFRMTVQDVFFIRGRGIVAPARVEYGEVRVGDSVKINDGPGVTVDAIEVLRKRVDTAQTGDNVGLLFKQLDDSDVAAGDAISSTGFFLA